MTIGLALEAYSQERVNYGSEEDPDWQNKYTMEELLDEEFRVQVDDQEFFRDLDVRSIEGIMYDEVK